MVTGDSRPPHDGGGSEQESPPGAAAAGDRLLRASRDVVRLWLGAAKWWTGAMVDSATAMRDTNERLLSDSTEAVARGFRGRAIEAELGGGRFVARVASVELYPGRRYAARLELDDACWEGLAIRRMSIAAADVALRPPPELALALAQVEVRGCVWVPEVVAWVDERTPNWRLSLAGVNLVEAATVKGGRCITIAPQLVDGRLELELRELGGGAFASGFRAGFA